LLRLHQMGARIGVQFGGARPFQGGVDLLTVRPTLRVGIRRWQVSLDTEFGVDWFSYFGTLSPADELGFHAEVVLRYDF